MAAENQIEVLGQLTNYKVAGSGKKLVILHGWGGSSDSWEKVMEILKNDFEIFVPDIPGFGKSLSPPKPWKLEDFAFWFKEFVEKLKIKPFFLLGHSFGGRVAIKFLTLFPQGVEKLILCSAAGIKPKPTFKKRVIFFLALAGNAIFSKKPFRRFHDKIRNLFYRFLRNSDWPKTKGTMKETLKNVLSEDLSPELDKINIKTLILWGEKDNIVPLKYGKIFAKKIKSATLKVLPKVRHSPHLEAPEILATEILNFLKHDG